jgi:hypothetical protein
VASTIVLIDTDTSTEPVCYLATKVEAQKNKQSCDKRDQKRYGESRFIHGMSVSQRLSAPGLMTTSSVSTLLF